MGGGGIALPDCTLGSCAFQTKRHRQHRSHPCKERKDGAPAVVLLVGMSKRNGWGPPTSGPMNPGRRTAEGRCPHMSKREGERRGGRRRSKTSGTRAAKPPVRDLTLLPGNAFRPSSPTMLRALPLSSVYFPVLFFSTS